MMRITVIINSKSRRWSRARLESTLRRRFVGHRLDVVPTAYAGHAREIAREAARRGVDTVVAVGGDGTVNEVLNGIMGSNTALGIIPAGTANDVASYFGLPINTDEACDIIAGGHLQSADVVCVNGWYYLSAGGFGIPCDVLAAADAIKQWNSFGRTVAHLSGSRLYVLALVHALLRGAGDYGKAVIQADERLINAKPFSVLVMNQPTLGRHFCISPRTSNQDGLLGLCVIEQNASRMRLLAIIVRTLRGRHVGMKGVVHLQAKRLSIRTRQPVSFFGDGEISRRGTTFDVHIIPGAVKIVSPATRKEN